MSAVFDTLYRITALGLVCGALLTIGGTGGSKEILRLGCACLMTVVLLTALRGIPIPTPDLSRYEDNVRRQVEDTQAELLQNTLAQTEADLEYRLGELAAALDLDCGFSVTCTADDRNRVTVREVEVRYQSGQRERLTELREQICTQLAITGQQLIIREALP